jgi:hypothetical protein
LITKSRSKYVYLRAMKRRPSGQMTVSPQYHQDLLERFTRAAGLLTHDPQLRGAAYYLRRAALSESLLAATFHTLQAADALATVGRKIDQKRLRKVMGSELYVYFRTEDPVSRDTRRHALAHGRLIDEEGLPRRTDELQERVVHKLRQALGGINEKAFTPVRGFVGFDTFTLFLEPIGRLPELPALVEAATEGVIHSQTNPRLVGTEVSQRLWRR